MPYIVHPDGSIQVNSVDDAIALSVKLTERRRMPPSQGATHLAGLKLPPLPQSHDTPLPPDQDPVTVAEPTRLEAVLPFLQAVRAAAPRGVGTETLLRVFGTDKPRALGGKIFMASNAVKALGLNPSDVFVGTRTPNGTVFTAGSNLDAAIAACDKALQDEPL